MGNPGGTGNEESPFDEDQMMNMFKGLLGNLGEPSQEGNKDGPTDK